MIIKALFTLAISVLASMGVYQFAPLSFFESEPSTLGTSVTTINGTDTISGSRTTINNNFTALNNGKIDVGTTSVASITTLENLATIGTITSGTWSGTALTWAKGGNASTTLSINQVLLGSTTSGFKVVSGYGTSGQFLTSNGSGNAPTWTTGSIDTTLDYNFTGSYFRIKNLNASSTAANPLVLNGVSYSTPTSVTNMASSSTPLLDTSGNISFGSPQWNYSNPAPTTFSNSTATTTIVYTSLPANSLGSTGFVEFNAYVSEDSSSGTGSFWFDVAYGNATSTFQPTYSDNPSSRNVAGQYKVIIMANAATNSQKVTFYRSEFTNTATASTTMNSIYFETKTIATDSTATQPIMFTVRTSAGGNTWTPNIVTGVLRR